MLLRKALPNKLHTHAKAPIKIERIKSGKRIKTTARFPIGPEIFLQIFSRAALSKSHFNQTNENKNAFSRGHSLLPFISANFSPGKFEPIPRFLYCSIDSNFEHVKQNGHPQTRRTRSLSSVFSTFFYPIVFMWMFSKQRTT